MSDVFVVEALRTPFGSFGGNLAEVPAPQLAATVVKALVARTGIPVAQIDQFIAGHVIQGGTGQAPARQAMRAAGLPDSIPAMTINKVCGSGLKAMMLAADAIRLGDDQLAIAGGMENMSLAPYALPQARYGMRMGNGEAIDLLIHDALRDPFSGRHMGEVTEVVVAEQGLNRQVPSTFVGTKEGFHLSLLHFKNGVDSPDRQLIGTDRLAKPVQCSFFNHITPFFFGF